MSQVAIVWLRRDLRVADNPALAAALADGCTQVVPVFIWAPDELGRLAPGGAQRVWLHQSLAALSEALAALGAGLLLRRGPSAAALDALIEATGAGAVYWNRLYDPPTIARDKQVKSHLESHGIATRSFKADVLYEPWTVETGQGKPYKVFTPFWRAVSKRPIDAPGAAPKALPPVPDTAASLELAELGLLPTIDWDAGIRAAWQPGESGAHARLDRFLDAVLGDYRTLRERPAADGTSFVSPHLHWGEIGPRQVVHRVDETRAEACQSRIGDDADTFLSEIGWREFARHVLYHFPATPETSMDARFADFPWHNDRQALRAWQNATTGVPMVDAGMRELWATGYMHNRVRMTVASFLTKNLRTAWQYGERWFWDTLVDADAANNTLGWQWAAGCGADAAPYFRIFNPARQGERFDADGAYVRRWLPELAAMPARRIHAPWTASKSELDQAGVDLGRTYPAPIVDLKQSRQEALAAFEAIKNAG